MGLINTEILTRALEKTFSTNFSILIVVNAVIFSIIIFFKMKENELSTLLIFPSFSTVWWIVFKIFENLKNKKGDRKWKKELSD